MSDYLELSLAKLKEFEGCIPWMYRDTRGLVTVGIGFMLPDPAAAIQFPFLTTAGPATPAQIEAEFARVLALPTGRTSSFYKTPDSLQLAQSAIDSRLRATLRGFELDLRARMPHYDLLPAPAKLALLDMSYNLGPAGLLHDFPHLIHAVETGNWTAAANACERRGPSAARNQWTRDQFLASVVSNIKAETEHWLARLWWRIRHIFTGTPTQAPEL